MAHYTARVLDDRRLELPEGVLEMIAPGQLVGIDIDSDLAVDQVTLQVLQELEADSSIAETDSSQTDHLIRDARDGAAYGL